MRFTSLLLYFVVFSQSLMVYAQSIRGHVIDKNSGEPIPYVNIGIVEKNFGTISNDAGLYKLTFSKHQLKDYILFQHVSYEPKAILVEDLIKGTDVYLEERVSALNEVIIFSKATKRKKIGIRTHNPLLWGGLGIGEEDIYEIAQEIKTNRTLRLVDFNIFLRIYQDSLPFKYRIKLYKSADGVPGDIIINDNIIIDGVVSGWNTVDLSPYNIVIKGDFFVSIEFLPSPNAEMHNIYAGSVLIGGNRYARNSSLGKWNKAQGGYKLYVTGEY